MRSLLGARDDNQSQHSRKTESSQVETVNLLKDLEHCQKVRDALMLKNQDLDGDLVGIQKSGQDRLRHLEKAKLVLHKKTDIVTMLENERATKTSAMGTSEDELAQALARSGKLQAKGSTDGQQLQLHRDQMRLQQIEVNKASEAANHQQDKIYVCTLEDRNVEEQISKN